MTVWIHTAPQTPPDQCPVCEGDLKVMVVTVVPTGIGKDRVRHLPTSLVLVIDCPQCVGDEELLAQLPRSTSGGGPRATA